MTMTLVLSVAVIGMLAVSREAVGSALDPPRGIMPVPAIQVRVAGIPGPLEHALPDGRIGISGGCQDLTPQPVLFLPGR
jgi:hypothetical protein